MDLLQAMRILGLPLTQLFDRRAILCAWRQKLRGAHPDKKKKQEGDGTLAPPHHEEAQRVNAAKDALLSQFEDPDAKKRAEAEEEARARAREAKERRRIRREKEACQAPVAVVDLEEEDDAANVRLGIRAFIDELRTFFRTRFEAGGPRVLVRDLVGLFMASRGGRLSVLERRLFQRHARRLCMEVWPHAEYAMHRDQRCFNGLSAIVPLPAVAPA